METKKDLSSLKLIALYTKSDIEWVCDHLGVEVSLNEYETIKYSMAVVHGLILELQKRETRKRRNVEKVKD